jgi:hypothetical protein
MCVKHSHQARASTRLRCEFASRVRQRTAWKPVCHADFSSVRKNTSQPPRIPALKASAQYFRDCIRRTTMRARAAIANCLLGDSEFFIECGSNRSAMHVDSDVHRSDIATHSLLGGQYGEESEESEEGKEGQEEEEVTLPRNNDAIDRNVDAASQRPTRPKSEQRNAAAVATSALVDDEGRRRNRGSSFTDTVFWSGFTGRFQVLACSGRRKASQLRGRQSTDDLSFSPMPSVAPDRVLSPPRAERRGFLFSCNPEALPAQPPFRRVLHSL